MQSTEYSAQLILNGQIIGVGTDDKTVATFLPLFIVCLFVPLTILTSS